MTTGRNQVACSSHISRIVASLVRAEPIPFLLNIVRWLLVAIPATWTNSWLSYIQNKLSIAYRSRLTNEMMRQYLGDSTTGPDGKVYYKLGEMHNQTWDFAI
jgi:ATP-binding cassette subfamily D (ALD) long-chain fatty acid import protein